jgi:hypothetical protein
VSRRSDVVRSNDQAQSTAVRRFQTYNWNAMIVSATNEMLPSGSDWVALPTNRARHTSFTDERDIDRTNYPYLRIRIPRNGIYSVSASVRVSASSSLASAATIRARSDSAYGSEIVRARAYLTADANGGDGAPGEGVLGVFHAGYPFNSGALVWLEGANSSQSELEMDPMHLSVTYEAELGIVHPVDGDN